jgi:3-oxoacyl-[acyl-carrier-protein] synthase-3
MRPAYDISAACAGFIFALELGALIVRASSSAFAYVVAAEARSRFLNKSDRRTVFLFGDAAAACLLTQTKTDALAQLLWTECSTQSFGEPEILIPAGGAKKPITSSDLAENLHKIKMIDGVSITEAVETKLVDSVRRCLGERGESIEDYRFFAFHQGNGQLIKHVLGQLGASEDQTWINFDVYGNSSSASVAVVLSEAAEKGLIKSGDKVLMVAMGAGYHLGVAALRWC